MFKLLKTTMMGKEIICCVSRLNDYACIPFALDNTDYQQFKKELANGVELKDADGNQMTPEQITTFLETLP